jgi:hypothetical protein
MTGATQLNGVRILETIQCRRDPSPSEAFVFSMLVR